MKLFNPFRLPTLDKLRAATIAAAEREAFTARRLAELYAAEAQRQTLTAEMLEKRIATLRFASARNDTFKNESAAGQPNGTTVRHATPNKAG